MFRFSPQQQASMEKSVAPLAVYQFIDKHVVTLLLSEGFLRLFGFTDHKDAYYVMDNNMYRDTHPDDISRIANEARKFATGESDRYNVIYRSMMNDGYHIIHAQGEHVTMPTGDRVAFVWYFDEGPYSEISGHQDTLGQVYSKMLTETSEANTHFDYLTGLPNMSYFMELSATANRKTRESGRTPVILFFDLCGSKDFSRRYGFEEGDNLIKSLAALLADTYGERNCSRFGQDQFVVCTDDADVESEVMVVLGKCTNLNKGKTTLVRAGIYVYENESLSPRAACDRAKVACDSLRGRNVNSYVFFDREMRYRIETNQYILDNLDKAIAGKWVNVYFQPIIRAANGRVCNEEALSRWIDPDTGNIIMPDDFVPILEKNNLIYKLDLYVVEQVIEKLKIQMAHGLYTVPVSINLSRSDFDSCDIVEEVRRRIDDSGISHDRIVIEITESTIGRDLEFMKEQIERFQSMGFKVWMDDFGRGYSSMDLLQEIHFDLIKRDMYFMRHFEKEKSRIIVIELIKMAIALGVETIVEGVETEEMREFLREAGCTKMQGFFYCKAIPTEEMLERYRTGKQIGFENPDERSYYTAIGNANLYDLSGKNKAEIEKGQYFSSLPMAVIETDGNELSVIRRNSSYDYFLRIMGMSFKVNERIPYPTKDSVYGPSFAMAVRQCSKEGGRQIVSERLGDGLIINYLVDRLAENPVSGAVALTVAVLDYTDLSEVSFDNEEMIPADSFVYALSADYTFLYYVDLENEHFVEYRPDEKSGELRIVRHGQDFFAECRKDALKLIYKDDIQKLISDFTKENVIRTLDKNKAYTLTYRLMTDDGPTYVNMKASRLGTSGNRIIIGVNNVDSQMKAQEAYERIKEEQATYARISALSGNYICIYTIDPKTDRYTEYSVTDDYAHLGLPKKGKNFFAEAIKNSEKAVFPGDLGKVTSMLSKEKVLQSIEQNGLFSIDYRLMMGGEPRYVSLKGALVQEADGPMLIMGVSDIDAQVKRDQEYAYNLHQAKARADIDALTGLRNKHAYIDLEDNINRLIEEKKNPPFALTLFDINDLKIVNDRLGHQAGDRYIKSACSMICSAFDHSPVFRVGGDEFVAISRGKDYENIDAIIEKLDAENRKNAEEGKIVVSLGMARYDGEKTLADVFDNADRKMYAYKEQIKLRKGKQ